MNMYIVMRRAAEQKGREARVAYSCLIIGRCNQQFLNVIIGS